jgi:hypothetical protein
MIPNYFKLARKLNEDQAWMMIDPESWQASGTKVLSLTQRSVLPLT